MEKNAGNVRSWDPFVFPLDLRPGESRRSMSTCCTITAPSGAKPFKCFVTGFFQVGMHIQAVVESQYGSSERGEAASPH